MIRVAARIAFRAAGARARVSQIGLHDRFLRHSARRDRAGRPCRDRPAATAPGLARGGAIHLSQARRTTRTGENLAQVPVGSREGWRDLLAAHHAQRESVRAVTRKKGHAAHVPQHIVVEEALARGWIDSLPRKLDSDRTMLLVSPRRTGSNWSKVNRDIVARLTAEGRMAPPGLAAVACAQGDGTWTALAAVETLAEPPDLAAALAATPGAAAFWAVFPPSSRRSILEWIAAEKRPGTRAARVAETAAKAALNRQANHPAGRDFGPAPGHAPREGA